MEDATLGEPPFDMWVEQERARLRGRLAKVLTDAVAHASSEGHSTEAVARARRLMSVAPFETSSAQLAATTLIAAGRRNEARDLLKQFGVTLQTELGLQLPAELQAMLSRIERQADSSDAAATLGASPRQRDVLLPFVGREAELSQLVTLCRTTAEEAGGFALLKGEAGMGKSRLLKELSAHLKSLGKITVLHGREHVAGIQLPYAVFAEALRPLARAPGVVGASRHLLAEAARLLPELRDEMELPAVTDVEDDAGRLRFFEGIAALIDAAAFERPIVLLLDDVHLAGPSTLELLSYLCARLSRSAVTIVLALRPSDAPAAMMTRLESIAAPDSQTHPGRSLVLALARLDPRAALDAASQATATLGLDAQTVSRLVDRGEGIPALLADLTRRAARGDPISSVPVSLREIVVDRAARLTSSQRRLLFVIALIGRPAAQSFLAAASHLPDPAVTDAIGVLASEGLIEAADDGSVSMDEPTSRNVLELAGPSTRAFLSGWIADALAARNAPFADQARFFSAAGQSRPAFQNSRRAAFAALALGAVPEATHHLQVARTFAPSPSDQASIESLLAALGAGKRQLAPSARIGLDQDSQASTPAEPESGTPDAAPRRFESLFPNWRLLLGAAVATLAISAIVLADRSTSSLGVAASLSNDTLLVSEDDAGRVVRFVTGDMRDGFVASQQRTTLPSVPAWIDSLPRPWENPIAAPRGQRVALERQTATGSDLFIISADRGDTTPVLVGAGDAHALGWSPDGRWLLASLARDAGSFDAQLLAFGDETGRLVRRSIDTTAGRSVMEAAWSPDGTRIAWVARVGSERQLEVFVSSADGSNARNFSRHPADDQHITWSPDGELLAFTSTRDDNAELYAVSFLEGRLWRLTFDPAQDDAASFSSDGRLIAFESTRGAAAGVYVMPALGGDVRRIEANSPIAIVRWTGRAPRYVDRVLIEQPHRVLRGDTAALRLVALDQFDEPLNARAIEWKSLDSSITRLLSDSGDAAPRVVSRGTGIARIVANVGRWRYDTALVALGSVAIPLVPVRAAAADDWITLGSPLPVVMGASAVLHSDREWDSGLLSRASVPLLPGLVFQASLDLPIAEARDPAASVNIAFVAPENSSTIDPSAPQFLRHASLAWTAASGRLVYAVGREVFSEPVQAVQSRALSPIVVQLRVEDDSTVSFRVGGRDRWRSSLRVLGPRQSARAQAWISARGTGDRVRISNVSIRILPGAPSSP